MAVDSGSKDRMSNLDTHLKDPGYILWVQAGTCIGFLKTFLEQLAFHVSASLHKTIMKNLLVCVQKQHDPAKMKMCNHSIISFKRTQNKWTISCCANCQCYIDQLVKFCDPPFKFRQSNWNNSDIQLWPTDHWEKAKVYMNYGQKRTQKTPQDTDLSGILNFIDNCSTAQSWWRSGHGIRKQKTSKVRDCRNAIMHSATFKISQQEFQEYTDAIIDLLQEFLTHPMLTAGAQDADDKIRETQGSSFIITTDVQFRVLRERASELRKQNKEVQRNMEELQHRYNSLKRKKDKHSKRTLEQLVIQTEEKEAELKALDETFASLKALTTENQDLTDKMKAPITKTFTALNKTRAKLTEVRKRHRFIQREEKDVIEQTIAQYQDREERYECLRQQNERLLKENDTLKKELKISKENTEKQAELRRMQLDDSKQELHSVKTFNKRLHKTIEELRIELCNTKTELDTIKTASENTRKENSELVWIKTEQDNIIYELRGVHIINNELRLQCEQLEGKLKYKKADYNEKVNELHNLYAVNKDLSWQIDKYSEELGEIKADFDSANKKLDGLIITNKELKFQNGQFQTELGKVKAERDITSNELQEIKHETSI